MFEFSSMPSAGTWVVIATCVLVGFFIFALWRRSRRPTVKQQFTKEYFRGLNYLLNDEQGKALDIFVKLVESDWEIIDTHFALGRIFRKNGEIDKAIKIHQGLIARPSLPDRYRTKVLLELAFDYLGAGWFDRAEGLFKEALLLDKHSETARRHLIMIYEQEKDWHKAIDVAIDLFAEDPTGIGPRIAQYFCELAELAATKGDVKRVKHNADQALRYDASCVRASIMLAELSMSRKEYRKALRDLERVEKQDAGYMPIVLSPIIKCYERLGQVDALIDYMKGLIDRQGSFDLVDEYAKLLEKHHGVEPVVEFLTAQLGTQPSTKAIQQLLSYYLRLGRQEDNVIRTVEGRLRSMQESDSEFKCHRCGFESNTLYWQCPSCQRWGSVKPHSTMENH